MLIALTPPLVYSYEDLLDEKNRSQLAMAASQ